MINIQQLERNLRPFKSEDIQAEQKSSDRLRDQVNSLKPEQQQQLERNIREGSETYFKMILQHVETAQEDIDALFSEHGKQLVPDRIKPILVAGGLDAASASETANTIAELAKRATSADDFHQVMKATFDPEQRLPLTLAHWRTHSEYSWYFATPEGQAQLAILIGEVETASTN